MIVLTPENNSAEVRMQLLHEYRTWRDNARKNVKPFVHIPSNRPTIDVAKFWQKINDEQNKKDTSGRHLHPEFKAIFAFVDENNLTYHLINSYQHRVKNPRSGMFVDWWGGKARKMRFMNGTFGFTGENNSNLLAELQKLL